MRPPGDMTRPSIEKVFSVIVVEALEGTNTSSLPVSQTQGSNMKEIM